MTCGAQQKMKITAAATNILASRRRDRSVDVCGNGNSDDGTFSSFFNFDDCKFCPRRMDLERKEKIQTMKNNVHNNECYYKANR